MVCHVPSQGSNCPLLYPNHSEQCLPPLRAHVCELNVKVQPRLRWGLWGRCGAGKVGFGKRKGADWVSWWRRAGEPRGQRCVSRNHQEATQGGTVGICHCPPRGVLGSPRSRTESQGPGLLTASPASPGLTWRPGPCSGRTPDGGSSSARVAGHRQGVWTWHLPACQLPPLHLASS